MSNNSSLNLKRTLTHPAKAIITTYNLKNKSGKIGVGRTVKTGKSKTLLKLLKNPSLTKTLYKDVKNQKKLEKKYPEMTSQLYGVKPVKNLSRKTPNNQSGSKPNKLRKKQKTDKKTISKSKK